MPAAFTRMSTLPKALKTASRSRISDSLFRTSDKTRSVLRPLAFNFRGRRIDECLPARETTTSAPASASPRASVRPKATGAAEHNRSPVSEA